MRSDREDAPGGRGCGCDAGGESWAVVVARAPDVLIGVLGGMGPAATLDFLDKLIAATPAERDQVAAVLRDAAASRSVTVIASAADAAAARAVLSEAGRDAASVLDLSPARGRAPGSPASSAPASEVIA